MVRPSLRTRSKKRVKVRTPGGRLALHFKREKPGYAKCAICGAKLNGVPRLLPSKLSKLPKTKKRPQRPYGGHLCPRCYSRLLIKSTRSVTL